MRGALQFENRSSSINRRDAWLPWGLAGYADGLKTLEDPRGALIHAAGSRQRINAAISMTASNPESCSTSGHQVSIGPRRIPQPHPSFLDAPSASAATDYASKTPSHIAIGMGGSDRCASAQTSARERIATAISVNGTLRTATACQTGVRMPCSRSADARLSCPSTFSNPSTSIAAAVSTTPATRSLAIGASSHQPSPNPEHASHCDENRARCQP